MLLGMGLVDVRQHVFDDTSDVIVSGRIENLPTASFRAEDSGRAEQSQVMAHERLR